MIEIERVRNSSQNIIDALNSLLSQLGADYILCESLLNQIIESENNYLFVAKDKEQIVGTLTLVFCPIPTGLKAWIEDVVVDEKQRGRGIARMLVERAIDVAKDRGVSSLNLTSRPEREAANRLYQSLGFDIRKTNFYRYNSDK